MVNRYTSSIILSIGLLFVGFVIVRPAPVRAASLFDASVEIVRDGSGKLFGVVNGQWHHFRSLDIFKSYAYTGKTIREVTTEKTATVRYIISSLGSRVYQVDEVTGQKLWFPNEASFLNAGGKWNEIVRVSGEDSRAYENARLVKSADDAAVYFLDIAQGTRALIGSAEDFLKANFQWHRILTVPPSLLAAYRDVGMFDASTPVEPLPTNNSTGLQVELRTIVASAIPTGTVRNAVATLSLKAAQQSVVVTGVTLTKQGFLPDNYFSGVSLSDEDGVLLGRPQRFADGRVQFSFGNGILVDASGKALTVNVDTTSEVVAGAQSSFTLSIQKSSDIQTAQAVSVPGTFPLVTTSIGVINGVNRIGGLVVDSVVLSTGMRDIRVGTKSQDLTRFRVTASGGEAVLLKSIVLHGVGSAAFGDFTGYKFIDDNNKVVATGSSKQAGLLLMTFIKDYAIGAGESRTLTLRADVVGGGERTMQFLIENDFDVYATGKSYGYGLATSAAATENGFPVGNGSASSSFNTVRLIGGDVVVALSAKSPSGAITRGTSEAVLALIEVRTTGEAVRWDRLDLQLTTTAPHTALLESIRLRPVGGSAVGTINSAAVLNKPATLTLTSSAIISASKSVVYEVVGRVSESATATDSYMLTITNAHFTVSGKTETRTVTGPIVSAVRPVREVSLLVRNDPQFTDVAAVAGQAKVKVGRLTFQVGAGEDVRIAEVSLEPVGGSQLRFSEGFANLKLGQATIATPSGGTYRFSLSTIVYAGRETDLDIYIDTTLAAANTAVQFRVADVVAYGRTSGARLSVPIGDTTTPAVLFKKSELLIATDATFTGGSRQGGKGIVVGRFVLSASGSEDIRIDGITVSEAAGSSGMTVTRGYKNLRLVDAEVNRSRSRTQISPVGGSGGDRLTAGPTLAPNQRMVLNIVVDAEQVSTDDHLQLIVRGVEGSGRDSRLILGAAGVPLLLPEVTF
ncbi:MAG: hypothetical protein WC052_01120 [Patescibacteria group bacterium]